MTEAESSARLSETDSWRPCPRFHAGYRYDLSDQEAIDLGRRSIYAAGHRDVCSEKGSRRAETCDDRS